MCAGVVVVATPGIVFHPRLHSLRLFVSLHVHVWHQTLILILQLKYVVIYNKQHSTIHDTRMPFIIFHAQLTITWIFWMITLGMNRISFPLNPVKQLVFKSTQNVSIPVTTGSHQEKYISYDLYMHLFIFIAQLCNIWWSLILKGVIFTRMLKCILILTLHTP